MPDMEHSHIGGAAYPYKQGVTWRVLDRRLDEQEHASWTGAKPPDTPERRSRVQALIRRYAAVARKETTPDGAQ